MTRYLTPSKICLLVLSCLYCDDYAAHDATIPVLSFIVSSVNHSAAATTSNHKFKTSLSATASLEDFERLLTQQQSKVTGRTLWDFLLHRLWSVDCLHALHQFFAELSKYLANDEGQPHAAMGDGAEATNRFLLSPVSPLGIFIRKAQLEFTRLQFHDSVRLWTALVRFRAPTETSWKRRHPTASPNVPDINLHSLGHDADEVFSQILYDSHRDAPSEEGFLSTEDIERVLEFQLSRLQRFGNRVPTDVRDHLRKLLTEASPMPVLAHFLRFFDAWRAGDYTNSFENLHRYFDYTMQSRDKSYYQYALLHMAILQADFGCFSEAIASMNETIATARENQDISCLSFSMSWLNHLCKAYPREVEHAGYGEMLGSEREGLAFLKAKAKENKMWSLVSATMLSEAKAILSAGDDVRIAIEQVIQSSHLNIKYHIQSNVGTQLLMQSSIYGRLGLNEVADSYCKLLLDAYSHSSPVEELVRTSCRRAHTLAHAGNYTDAMAIIKSIDHNFHRNLKHHQLIEAHSRIFQVKRALRRQDMPTARNLLTSLVAGAPPDPDLAFQISLLDIEYHTILGNLDVASDRISDLESSVKHEDADVYQQLHLMILRAMLFAKVGIPEKGFSIVVRAAAVSYRARIVPSLWESVGALANILISLKEWDAARMVLDSIIPQAVVGGDTALCAQLYSWHADAHVGLAGKEVDHLEKRQYLMKKAEHFTERSKHYYDCIKDTRDQSEAPSVRTTTA